jgi:hypothetical protein
MSIEGQNVVIPPPPKGDASGGGKGTPVDGALKNSCMEQLPFDLKQLKLQRKIDKLKKKLKDSRSWQLTSFSSSNEETDASSKEEVKGRKGRKRDKRSYNTTSFNYDNLTPSSAFTLVPVGKAPISMGQTIPMEILDEDASNLAQSECLDYYAYRCWVSGWGRRTWIWTTSTNLSQCSNYISAPILIGKDEFDRVNGLEKAKDIWDTLQIAHEGIRLVKKAKRQLIEGQLDRFVMIDNESPEEMYNRLKKLVNKVRAYGSRRWSDRRMIDRMLWAYVVMDKTVISLIKQDPTFKKITPDDVFGKIVNYEILVEEVTHVKNLSKGITSSRK